jgi:hypothetical protein
MAVDRPYSRSDIVRAWATDGWDASQAGEWIDAGWQATPDDWDLETQRDIASIAVEWRDAGYGPANALSWDLAATSPAEATAWAEAGYSADDALAVVGQCQVEYNLDPARALQADRPQHWRESGLPVARIIMCIRAGVSVKEALALPLDDPATDQSLGTLAILRAPAPGQSLA